MSRCVAKFGIAAAILLPWMIPAALRAQAAPSKPDALEQQVQKYLQEQKPQLAIPLLRRIVSIDAKNLTARANLGVLLFFQNGFAEAVPHLRAAFEAQPDLWKIEALLGIAEKRTGDPAKARDDLERAFSHLDEQKIRIEAGLELIELESAAAQFEKALVVAVKLEELAPQDPQILLAAYQISRQVMYQSLLNMTAVAPESAQMHMVMAGELARQGNHVESIAHYRTALRLNPALPGAHFELAEQLRTSTDAELSRQAENEYKAAIKLNPYDVFSWRELGGIMTAQGDFKAAEEDYGKALALQPRDSDARTGLAIALISLNRAAEAIAHLETAVKDDPTNIVAHFRLSGLYRRAGRTTEADREMEAFHHYQDLKDKLGKVFKGLSGPASPR